MAEAARLVARAVRGWELAGQHAEGQHKQAFRAFFCVAPHSFSRPVNVCQLVCES